MRRNYSHFVIEYVAMNLKTGVKCVHCSDTRVDSFPWRKSLRRALADFLTCDIGEAFWQNLWVMSCKKPYLRLQLLANLNPPFPTKVVWHAWICHITVWVVWHYKMQWKVCILQTYFYRPRTKLREGDVFTPGYLFTEGVLCHFLSGCLVPCSFLEVYGVTSCLAA